MMNASHQEGQLGGMLREAVMTARLDEDASSVSMSVPESSAIGGATGDAMRGVLREMSANLEVLYFNKGSVLVKEGERAPGLYYVIDGFLDVSSLVPREAIRS
jgi:lysophospholipid hydrolase